MQYDEHEKKACEDVEKKLLEISTHAVEHYEKNGSLSSRVLLEEINELDGILNKQLLEERIAQYRLLGKEIPREGE